MCKLITRGEEGAGREGGWEGGRCSEYADAPLSTNRRPRAIKLLPAPISPAPDPRRTVCATRFIIPKFLSFFMPFMIAIDIGSVPLDRECVN